MSILEPALRPGDVVAIVDGAFLHGAAVRHKELLHLLDLGIEVWGAGGIGALRAAELRSFGMRGVGIVYRLFALGALERDDEVAVLHDAADDSYRQLGDALVSIRVVARRARRRRLIDRDVERALVAVAGALPFAKRRYETVARLAEQAGADRRQCAAFLDVARGQGVDVMRYDAELLLGALRSRTVAAAPASAQRTRSPLTRHLAGWIEEARGEDIDDARVTDLAALAFCQAFASDYPAFHRELALRAIVAAAGTGSPRAGAHELEVAALEAGLARGLLVGRKPRPNAVLTRWLDEEERHLPAREACLRVLVRSYRQAPGVASYRFALDALDGTFAFAVARRQVARALQLDAMLRTRDPRQAADRIPETRVRGWLADRWGVVPSRDRFELAAHDRGFVSNAEAVRRTRMFIPYATAVSVPAFTLGEHAALVREFQPAVSRTRSA